MREAVPRDYGAAHHARRDAEDVQGLRQPVGQHKIAHEAVHAGGPAAKVQSGGGF